MPENKDQSIHGYQERYQHILYQIFPDRFPKPIPKKEGNPRELKPFSFSPENKEALWKYYEYQQATNENSVARRWTIFRLLSRITMLLEEPSGFPKTPARTYSNLLTNEKGKDMCITLAQKVRSQPKWNRTTENFHLRCLKQLLRFMNGGETTPPCISWLKFKRKKSDAGQDTSKAPKTITRGDIITEEEMGKLLQIAPSPILKCAFACLWEGLRAGELLGLRKEDVHLENGNVLISVQGKTGQRTVVSATGSVYIRQWLSQHPSQEKNDWLFVITSNKNKGQRYSYTSLVREVKMALKKAKIIKRGNLHVFRHSRVVDMLIKGYNPAVIQKIMGWTSLDMLQTYGHLVDEDAHKEVLRIELGKQNEKPIQSILINQKCPICAELNPHNADLCNRCGNPLTDAGAAKKNEQYEDLIQRMKELERNTNAERRLFLETMKIQNSSLSASKKQEEIDKLIQSFSTI